MRGSTIIAKVLPDEDGWYQIVYNHTGKEAPYTVTIKNIPGWGNFSKAMNAMLKANAYKPVDFFQTPP